MKKLFALAMLALPAWAALPVITSFTTSSQTANGGSVTLNCGVTGTTTDIEIDNGAATFSATNSSCGGGISRTPLKTTLYKLVAGNNTGSDGQTWAYQRVFFGAGNLVAPVTNCSGATQNSSSCVITIAFPGSYSNPYTDAVCDFSFVAPSSAIIKRTSYWDPIALIWKVSFRPVESGAYTYSGFCGANPAGGPNNYRTVSGSFTSTASSAGGFLALYGGSAPYRLKTAGDGKPFYPLGIQQGLDTSSTSGFVTFMPNTPGTNVYPTAPDPYFSTYAAAGTNIYRNNGESFSGLFGGQYCDANGLNNFDTPSIFALDTLAAKASQYGIKLQTVPYYNPDPNLLPGYNFFGSLKTSSCVMNLWLEYFARYGDQTNIWELGNEILPNVQYIKTLTNFIRTQDPYRHLSTISNVPAANSTLGLDLSNPHFYFSDTIDPAAVQTLDNTIVNGVSGINSVKALFPNQPVTYGEIGDNCPAPDADPPANERWRDMLWTAFTNYTGAIAWNSFNGNGAGCGSGLSNLYVGTTQRAQQLVFSNLVANFDALAVPVTPTLGNLGSNSARVYALAGSSSVIAYITHANNHSTTVSGATVTLNIPSSGLTATWYNPFNGSVLGASSPSSGSQTLTIPSFSQDIVLKIVSSGGGGTSPTILSTSPLPGAVVGSPFSFQFTASGSTPITYAFTGSLPWASLDTNTGILTGTPASGDVGTKTIAVTATNGIGNSGPINFSITVAAAPPGGGASVTLCNGTVANNVCTAGSSTVTNYPEQYGQPFVQGEIGTCPQVVYDGTPLTTQADVKQRWTDGSVKHAILAVLFSSITPGGHTITYQAQACSNTPLSKTQMLASGFNFGAQMRLTNGSTVTGDARVMLNAWDGTTQDFNVQSPVQLWTSGQVAQTAIIALHGNSTTCNGNPCSTYDIGFDANKSIRPIFHATFWPGTNQVHVRYIGEMANSTTVQASQTYSLALTAGNTSPSTVYTKGTFVQSNGQRWTKDFWIGGTPSSTITLTPNLAYLRTTNFVPYYDTTTPLNSGTATTIANAWAASSKDIGDPGNWFKDMGTAGSRPDIGPLESWVVDWLYDGRQGLRDSAFGNADLQAAWPFHFREGSSGKILNRGDVGSTGLGKIISISGRPTMCINPTFFNFNASPGDTVGINLGNTGSAVGIGAQGWNWDAGHIPEAPVVQYTLSGDFWYLEESMFYNSLDTASGYRSIYYRGPTGAEGSLMYEQLRAMAWNLRGLANVTFIIPDAMPEKTYFRTIIADSIAIEEGVRNVTNGAYNGTTLWNYGRNTVASNGGGSGATFDSNGVVSILHQYARGNSSFSQDEYGICSTFGQGTPCNPPTVSEASPLFETDYLMTSLGRCKALGYLCDSLLSWASGLYTGMLTNSGFNPYILDNGRVPTYDVNGNQFSTFAGLKTGYNSAFQNATSYGTVTDPDGYLAYATAAVSYMTGETNGPASWNFLLAHGMSQATFSLDPKWHVVPASAPACSIAGTLSNGTVGTNYGTQTLIAQNCGASTLTWSITAGSLPTGLSGCNSVTGQSCSVTGTPTTTSGSPFSATIRVTDGGSNTASQTFAITITPAAVPPTISSTSPLPNCIVGSPCNFQFAATGTTPITWTSGALPAGLALSTSGALSGTPTTAATSTLAITATNVAGHAGPTNFSLTVNPNGTVPVILSSSPLPNALVGSAYSFTFTATGTPVPTWSATGSLPWGTLNPTTGVLTGTPGPADTGARTIAVTATNTVGNSGPQNFVITTNRVPSFLTTSPLPSATNGTAYSFQFTANGFPAPTYSATGVPTGLTLSVGGLLSGTPTVNGTSTMAVTITNSVGSVGPTNFSITVNALITPPVITSNSPLPTAIVNQAYSYQFTSTGSTPTWSATGLPSWASISSAGLLSGTPNTAVTTTIAVTATNAAGTAGPTNFVLPVLQAPAILTTSQQFPGGSTGSPFTFQFVVSGTPTPTCSATGLPSWATLSSSCLFSGTPDVAANTTFALSATNSVGIAGPTNFTIVVTSSLVVPTITTTSPIMLGSAGVPYSFPFNATGTTPFGWSVTGGALPVGFTLNNVSGVLSGTTTSVGVFSFTVTATNAAGSTPKVFSLTISSSPLSYTIVTTGPHHLVVGNYLFFNIIGTINTGNDEAASTAITGLPANVTAIFTNQIKFCCGPTVPNIAGQGSGNPVQITAAANATPGSYVLTVTYTSIPSGVVQTAPYVLIVDPVPAPLTQSTFPADIPLAQLAQWQSNMLTIGSKFCQPPLGGPAFEGFVWYYDGTRVYYQVADYTHNQATWVPCAQGLNALYQSYVISNAGMIAGWHVFPKGLAMDFARTGDPMDQQAIQLLQIPGYANFGNVAPTIDFLSSREISYGLETNLESEAVGFPRIANFQNVVNVLFGHFDQWFQSQTAPFVEPFMVALGAEALIQYYDQSGDPRVPPMLKLAADLLWSVSFDPLSNSMLYYNYDFSANPIPHTPYPYDSQCSNHPSGSITCEGPSPDLNLLIAPLYGWVYQHTGDITYRNEGDILFNAGVLTGCPQCDGKHFSQNYRWSERYVEWRRSARRGTQVGGSASFKGKR